jgi:hypothetical protein
VYKKQSNLYSSVNILRPYSAWNIPIQRRDPGPDGVLNNSDDGGTVTLYDYDPAYRGAAFVGNANVNRASDHSDYYHTLEMTLNKRSSQNWDMLASVSTTKNHRWIVGIPQSPNDNFNPLDETWDWMFKVSGGYTFPYDVRFGSFLQYYSGNAYQRTYVFRRADPDGGLAINQANTVTLRLEPYGAHRLPNTVMVNFRVSKNFRFGGKEVAFNFDLFNALNSNTASGVTAASGPSYGNITGILPPRIARIGGQFRF